MALQFALGEQDRAGVEPAQAGAVGVDRDADPARAVTGDEDVPGAVAVRIAASPHAESTMIADALRRAKTHHETVRAALPPEALALSRGEPALDTVTA